MSDPTPGTLAAEGTCGSCARWVPHSDGMGTCAVLVNDPAARVWRTRPGRTCVAWVPGAYGRENANG